MNVPDALDVSLEDTELLAEVVLSTEVIIGVQGIDRALTDTEIDQLLGLLPITQKARRPQM